MENGDRVLSHIQDMMETPFTDLSEEHKEMLDKIGINAWDLIQANSGGHKCITNISGINSLYRKKDGNGQKSYVDLTKEIQQKFYEILQTKINSEK